MFPEAVRGHDSFLSWSQEGLEILLVNALSYSGADFLMRDSQDFCGSQEADQIGQMWLFCVSQQYLLIFWTPASLPFLVNVWFGFGPRQLQS